MKSHKIPDWVDWLTAASMGILAACVIRSIFPKVSLLIGIPATFLLALALSIGYRHALHLMAWHVGMGRMRREGCTCFLVRGGTSILYSDCPYHSVRWKELDKFLGREPKIINISERKQ